MSGQPRQRLIVVGSSFAGLIAALQHRRERLDDRPRHGRPRTEAALHVDPSLIWVAFGLRDVKDIGFPFKPDDRRLTK
jgi:thioredoxin reductase